MRLTALQKNFPFLKLRIVQAYGWDVKKEHLDRRQGGTRSRDRPDMQKDYFCPGTKFWLKNVRTSYLEKFFKLRVLESIFGCKMHEYSEICIHLSLIFSISKQNFNKMSWYLWFLKNVRTFHQKCPGTRFPGSQVPDFLHVWDRRQY